MRGSTVASHPSPPQHNLNTEWMNPGSLVTCQCHVRLSPEGVLDFTIAYGLGFIV